MFDKNSEASFLLNGVFEFIKVWQSGNKSTLKLHSRNGKAWINFYCCLGGPLDQHEKFVPKPKSKSKRKQERDNLRAQLHQQRLKDKNSSGDGSLNLHLSSLSSQNESEMEVASSSFIQNETAASSSSSPNKDNPNTEARNEKSGVSDSFKVTPAAKLVNKHHQIDCENVEHDSYSEESTNQYCSESEVQKNQESLSTQENSECEPLLKNSDCVEHIMDSHLKTYYSIRTILWDSDLQKQDAVWQNMFEENPKIDLFPLCFKYFQNVKWSEPNEEVFNKWLKKQKVKYPHRLVYQRMKPEDF